MSPLQSSEVSRRPNFRGRIAELKAAMERARAALSDETTAIAARDRRSRLLLSLTFWPDLHGQSGSFKALTCEAISARIKSTSAAAKHRLPLFSGGRFGTQRSPKGSLRHARNLTECTAIVGDYDASTMAPGEAADRLRAAGIVGIIYTTPSHRPDKPRWRVLAPLARPCSTAEYKALMDYLDSILGRGVLAPESWTPVQAYFYGHVAGQPVPDVYVVARGASLDELAGADVPADRGDGSMAGAGGARNSVSPANDGDSDLSPDSLPPAGAGEETPESIARLESALARLDPDCSYDRWFLILACIHATLWQCAEDIARSFSARGTKYDPAEFDRVWATLRADKPGGASIGTIFDLAKKAGWVDPGRTPCAPSAGIALETMADCAAAPPIDWLIKYLIVAGTVNAITGEPGSGKSLIALRLAYLVATGGIFCGRRTRQGLALYIAGEDAGSLRRRFATIGREYGETSDLLLVTKAGAFDLRSRETPDAQAISAIVRERRPALVIADTFAALTPGMDENSGAEMGAAVAFYTDLCAATGCTCIILHHPKKGADDDLRGHGSIKGTMATVIALKRDDDGLITARTVKVRDGDPNQRFRFSIAPRHIGQDEDGEIFAPLAVEADGQAAPRTAKLSKAATSALAILREMGGEADEGEWRARCLSDPRVSSADKAESRSRIFRGAFESLARAGLVVRAGEPPRVRLPADPSNDHEWPEDHQQ